MQPTYICSSSDTGGSESSSMISRTCLFEGNFCKVVVFFAGVADLVIYRGVASKVQV